MTISNNANVQNTNVAGHVAAGGGIFNLNNTGDHQMSATIENGKYADGFAEGFRKGSNTEGGQQYAAGAQNGYANGSIVTSNALMDVIYALRLMHPQQRRSFLDLLATIVEV